MKQPDDGEASPSSASKNTISIIASTSRKYFNQPGRVDNDDKNKDEVDAFVYCTMGDDAAILQMLAMGTSTTVRGLGL
jgi:hypothetical protein